MEDSLTIKTLEIGSVMTPNEKLIFNWIKEALNRVKGRRSDKIIYACGGWVRDKLFFNECHGNL